MEAENWRELSENKNVLTFNYRWYRRAVSDQLCNTEKIFALSTS